MFEMFPFGSDCKILVCKKSIVIIECMESWMDGKLLIPKIYMIRRTESHTRRRKNKF